MHLSKICNSWTIQFLEEWRQHMTLLSAWRYSRSVSKRGESVCETALSFRDPLACTVCMRVPSSDQRSMEEVVIQRVYDCIIEHVPGAQNIIDLGANIGFATLFFANQYPEARFFAVEPHAETFALLEKNTARLSSRNRCRRLLAAVWSERGRVSLAPTPQEDDRAQYDSVRVQSSDDLQCQNDVSVESFTIADIYELSGFSQVDILKIDIEGAEAGVFTGDTSWLEKTQTIAIEFHEDARGRSGFDCVMSAYGFRIRECGHTTIASK